MKRNKLLTFALLVILLLFIISIFKEDYLSKVNSINDKYIIELYKTDNLASTNYKIKEFSSLSAIFNKKIEIINSENYANLDSKEKYIIYLGAYSSKENCNADLLEITNKYYSNAIAYVVDTNANTSLDYQRYDLMANPIILDKFQNNFDDYYRITTKSIIENHPIESFNESPFLVKNDTVSCINDKSFESFSLCRYESEAGSFVGFVKSNSLIKIDITATKIAIDSLEYLNLKLVDIKDLFNFKKDSLLDSISQLNSEIFKQETIISRIPICTDVKPLIFESISLDRIVYISTFGTYRRILFNKKDKKKRSDIYLKELPNVNTFKFYITDKKGTQILGSRDIPINANICSMSKIMVL